MFCELKINVMVGKMFFWLFRRIWMILENKFKSKVKKKKKKIWFIFIE